MGTRLTVFPRAAWATLRGLGRDADVVLEVCNGIAFFTSFWRWMRKPRVLLVFHVHQEHYVTELGLRGRVAAFLLEQVPLQIFYPGVPVITISQSSREDLVALGVERERIHVVYCGLDSGLLAPGPEAPEPTLIYLGRLKQYKRIELLLDVLEAIPEAHLDLAGDGDHRAALEAEVERRGLGDRVDLPRPRRRGGEGAAAGARVGGADRLVGRGLVPDRVRGRRLRHADGGDARRRPRARRSSTGRPACWPTSPPSSSPPCAISSTGPSSARRSARPPSSAPAATRGTPRRRAR